MKIKYRIKSIVFPTAKTIYIPQYRVLGLWLSINSQQIGSFLKSSSVFCETFDEAKNRIIIHKENMKRAKEWFYSFSTTKIEF
jgi:hypothetical protein